MLTWKNERSEVKGQIRRPACHCEAQTGHRVAASSTDADYGKGFFMNIDQRPGISKGFSTLLVGAVLGISTAIPLGIFTGWLIWG